MNQYWLFPLLVLVSCNDINAKKIDTDLIESTQKVSQLEKVLSHYKSSPADSLKYKAAIFLIENMSDKFSYRGKEYNAFLNFTDSLSNLTISSEAYKTALINYKISNHTLAGRLEKAYDAENITTDYLIKNIDDAFSAFSKSLWSRNVEFDDFCEYILPYRIGNEPIEDFRTKMQNKYKFSHSDKTYTIQMAADSILNKTSTKGMLLSEFPDFIPGFPASSLINLKGGSCVESSNLAIYIMRSFGIPVAQDFTPQWPHRASSHYWCALIVNKDSCIDFEGANAKKIGGHLLLSSSSNKVAKVFRRTYSRQSKSLAMIHGNEEIPDLFTDPYFKDVSKSYYKGANITINLSNFTGNKKYAYICVFNNKDWVPIHWGTIENNQVSFNEMGKSIMYLAAVYNDNEYKSIDNPILVDSTGNIKRIIADENKLQSMILKRKYPIFDWWDSRTLAMKGCKFQAANNPEFSDAIDIYTIKNTPELNYNSINITTNKKYKYWRFLSADSSYGDIAELEFYDEKNKMVEGKIIGSKPSEDKNDKPFAFDKKALTYFQGFNTNNNWVGLELDKPIRVKKIRFLPRNDDNFINNGEEYELYYWKDGGWKSLGFKIGDSTQVLIYKNVPSNALYLLKNHTKGQEERIFTYENDKQVWW